MTGVAYSAKNVSRTTTPLDEKPCEIDSSVAVVVFVEYECHGFVHCVTPYFFQITFFWRRIDLSSEGVSKKGESLRLYCTG